MDENLPAVLVIDDEADLLSTGLALALDPHARARVLHPRDVAIDDLEWADLVLVDYRLEDWQERDEQVSIGLQPMRGVGLGALLREHVSKAEGAPPTAFAIHSAHLDDLRGTLPAVSGEHLIARTNNLEWAFAKSKERLPAQVGILASAVRRLPTDWANVTPSEVQQLLGLEEADWSARGWVDVENCQAPIHELRAGGHAFVFLRWLLHQVLPYPTFLWGQHWLAARLRITVSCLTDVLENKGELRDALHACAYGGICAGFLGPRWWRAGIEEYLWEATGGGTLTVDELHSALSDRTSAKIQSLGIMHPAVCVGADLSPTGQFVSVDEGVRLRPDQWPSFAEVAWVLEETAREQDALRDIVDPLDRARLE